MRKERSQPMEAGAFTKFRLLMWKNFLQQWRHRIQTVVELLLPVLTITVVLILRWQVEPEERDTYRYPPIPAHSLNFSTEILLRMNITRMSVAYSPTSPELDDVVRSAVSNMMVRNVPILIPVIADFLNITLPEINLPELNTTEIVEFVKGMINVTSYRNSEELSGIYNSEDVITQVIAAIQFEDDLLGATQLPRNINYSLRFPERPRMNTFFSSGGRSWRTQLVFPIFESPGPRYPNSWEGGRDPGYVNEMFIVLQNAVSLELISRLTGVDMRNFNINLQRYPHPPYVHDMAIDIMQMLLPLFITLSFSYTAVNIVRAVTVEKELQLKETMKIMGLPTWLHWTAWFCKQFVYLIIVSVLIVILLKVNWFSNEDGFSDYAVVTNTPWTVLLFFLLMYMACMIFFCFMISGIFSSASTAALFTGVVWFLSGAPAALLSMDNNVSLAMQAFTCLSINSAMTYGFQLMLASESTGGLQWGEFMSSPSTDTSRFLFGHVIIMLVVDSVVYMLVALYLEQVLPGPLGTPKPWYFPLRLDFWCGNRAKQQGTIIYSQNDDAVLKEKDPTGHSVGVQISNLTKVFANNVAVDHLSLNIYDDQITVLLGHNGAGKSTTISMLTGNLACTHGSVILAGYNMNQQPHLARSHLGLCPQHNVLFNELTVKEHLQFFARLKGFKGNELEEDIESLIEKLELQEKRDYQSSGLSGGQKRRLCVGIALSGGARVVLLDEPTSGMDPASRRGLWDLLQKEKKGRSMILTTHFMDEADYLGDRVAIMAHGRLQCVGSPQFLKSTHGVGYSLVLVKDTGFDYDKCVALVHKYIPGTQIQDDRGSEVTFNLLNEHAPVFEEMLDDFEKNIDEIRFKNYGLIATTLEDVFMTLGADLAPVNNAESEDGTATIASTTDGDSMDQLNRVTEPDRVPMSRSRLLFQHVLAMWMKLWLVWSRSWGMVLLQLVVPVLLINMTLGVSTYVMSFVDGIEARNLTLTQGFASTETLLNYVGSSVSALGAHARVAYEDIFVNAEVENMALTVVNNNTLDDYYLDRAQDTLAMRELRHSVLIGATFDDDTATAWFSNFGYHDVAMSLNAVHSALLRARDSVARLNVFNYPLEAYYSDQTDMQVMVQLLSVQLASGIGSSIGIVSAVFAMFYIKERVSGAKLLQKAAGLQPVVMWGSAAVVDWLWFLVCCISVVISCFAFNVMGLNSPAELGRLYICFMVYGVSMLPMNYLFSLLFQGPAIGFVVVFFINVLFGMMGPQVVEALYSPQLDTEAVADALDGILQFFPMYSFVTSVRLLNKVAMTIESCLMACNALPAQLLPNAGECSLEFMCRAVSSACCVPEDSHFAWEDPGMLRYLVMMLISGLVFWIVLMIIEYRIPQMIFTFKKVPPPIDRSELDEDVADEELHVERIGKGNLAQHGLIARGLSKYYGKHLAVDQINFSVNNAECFGLLGVNGAGKTTTFKMLMGDESISSGDAYVSGYSVQKELRNVHQNIGYCPQFDALFNELTGRETLRLFSLLRGLRPEVSEPQIGALAQALGFMKHLDKRVSQYSGGTKRKLNTAVAFLGWTRLVFVDEPTTGVDPAAKRHMWRAVRGVQKSGRGVVLTSHSMEECEALCSRLTIMVNGRFQCLGTPQHLKNKFSQGYTLTIKLKQDDNLDSESSTAAVKAYVNSQFIKPKIMEEYQGVLTYYLADRTMAWSRMFGIMERAKRDLPVEYYSISQTTLEQIFLQFTKYQKEEQRS